MSGLSGRGVLVVAVVALVAVASSCTQPYLGAPTPPEADVWIAGDSVSYGVGEAMPTRPWVSSVGNSGFTAIAKTTVFENTMRKISLHGPPEVVLVMAGVVDISLHRTPAEVIVAMQEFEADMAALGVDVVWLAEPGWTYSAGLEEIATWVNTRPNSVDCRHQAGGSADGVHPSNYSYISQCVSAGVSALGVTWDYNATVEP